MQIALLAAVSGLVGIILGRFWDTLSESQRWRRDQRVQSYQAVAGEFYRYRDSIRELGRAPRSGPVYNEGLAEVSKLRTDWNRSLATLWLHGSERAAACALSVDNRLSKLSARAMNEGIPDGHWPTYREPALVAYDDFVDAVRNDLSLSPLTVLRAGAATRSLGLSTDPTAPNPPTEGE